MSVRPALAALLLGTLIAAGIGCSKSDLSTPKAAAKTFATAMMGGDAEGAKKASTGGDAKMIETMTSAMGNFKKLRDAAVAKYGDAGKAIGAMGGPGGGEGDDDMVKAVDESTEQITGDTATLTMKKGKPMKLKKVDGAWKVDASDMAGPEAGMAAAMLEPMGKAAKETADEIAAGQHKTLADAQAAMAKKFMSGGKDAGGK